MSVDGDEAWHVHLPGRACPRCVHEMEYECGLRADRPFGPLGLVAPHTRRTTYDTGPR